MSEQRIKSQWLCVQCGRELGVIAGGEFYPHTHEPIEIRTNGPNLTVVCPSCGTIKTWYTADQVVRAIYQLVDALANVSARAMTQQMSAFIHENQPLKGK